MKKADLAHVTVCRSALVSTNCVLAVLYCTSVFAARLCPWLSYFPALPLHLRQATLRATLSDTAICCFIIVYKEKAQGWCPTWIPLQTQTSVTTSLAIPLSLSRARAPLKKPLSIKMQCILQKNVNFCPWTKNSPVFSKKLKKPLRLNKMLQGFLTIRPLLIRPRLSLISDSDVHVGRGKKGAEPRLCRKSWFSAETAELRSHSYQSAMLMM